MEKEVPVGPAGLWQRAVENFGSRTVAFLLDLDENVMPTLADIGRWDGVRTLASLAASEPTDVAPEVSLSNRVWLLARPGSTGSTLAEEIRVRAGGRVRAVPDDDDVLRLIVRVAFTAMAAEFIPGVEHDRFALTSASSPGPAQMVPLCQAFISDPSLKKFFPAAPAVVTAENCREIIALHWWSLGGAGTTWLIIMLGRIVESTLARMRFERNLNEESLVPYFRDTLRELRLAADGQEISVPVLAGLKGAAPVRDMRTEQGGILPADGLGQQVFPQGQPLQYVAYTYAKTRLMAVFNNEDYAERKPGPEEARYVAEMQAAFHEVRRNLDLVRFWIVVWAHENGRNGVKPTLTVLWVVSPSSMPSPAFGLGAGRVPMQAALNMSDGAADGQSLGDEDIRGIAAVADRLPTAPKNLSLGVSRIVRAAIERDDPMDSFVDAVIAWENLVGAKTETTFRVCAALATILEPTDTEQRRALFKKLKGDYNKRSQLVHGGEEPKPEEMGHLRDRALKIAIQAMCRVLEDDQLRDLKSSQDRSDAVLVGGWQP
jgi:hypothetical protein